MRKIKKLLVLALVLVMAITSLSIVSAAENSNDEENLTKEELYELSLVDSSSKNSIMNARIMQGNTNEEDDCREIYNGLDDNGNYDVIVDTGWTYTNSTTSSINDQRTTDVNFKYAYLYDFAYYSGHGSYANDIPTLNATPSNSANASGTWSEFDVHTTLDVDGSNWDSTCEWDTDDDLRVLILACCEQLDSDIMHYYARVMKASGVRAIAGYHETGPGHDDDMEIAVEFMDYAQAGNSVWYSWEHGNEDIRSSAPWAVLVYKAYYNQYYRIPGFPGNTYSTPGSTASVYRYASHLSGSQEVSTSKSTSAVNTSALPLYITVAEDTSKSVDFKDTRECADTTKDVAIDYATTNSMVSKYLGTKDFDETICVQTPVVCAEVNIDGGIVKGSEIVTERIYKYFDTYNGVRVNNSFISVFVDSKGVNTVTNKWKTVNTSADSKVLAASIISEEAALKNLANEGYTAKALRISLVYQPVSDTKCKLMYEYISVEDDVVFVDAETGEVFR